MNNLDPKSNKPLFGIRMKRIKRINFYMVDVFERSFLMLSAPYELGDGMKGGLAKMRRLVTNMKDLYSSNLRKHHGFQGMKRTGSRK